MADTVGNRLGPRGTFVYTSDSLIDYNITLDRSVALAVGNTLSTDATLPIVRASGRRPIEPRSLLLALVSDPTITKKAIVSEADNTLFAADGASTVTINGVSWVVTGRVGEKRSTLRLTP
jgi:hypothetical protein